MIVAPKAPVTRVVANTALLTLSLLCGCMVGPNYHRPAMPVPPAFEEQHTDNSSGAASASSPDWWRVFQDPVLNDLEGKAVATNLDIPAAVARVDQADAIRRSVGSYRYPTIAAQPQFGRSREAQDRPNNGNTGGLAKTQNDLQLPLTMSYEVDAWGRIRRQVQAATANEQASAADLQFVRLTVAASVATDYFAVREADAETKIVSDTQIELERGFKVTSDQFRRGIISELAVKQSQAILDQARAQLEALYLRRAQSEHAIAVLCGVPAEGFHIQVQDALQNLPSVPPGLPAAMLQRRPDILAAERLAAAASAQIGVAKAAYYPSFTLSAAAGYESVNPASILNWQNTIASLIGSATAPIFTGGRLRANVDQATAAYREAVANYEKSVLVGYGDVEDQLAAIHYLARQADAENSVVSSATRAEEIASNRYKAGLVSYLDVVFAQQTLLQNEQVLTQLKGQQAVATVSLIRALGGGW
jgi:outer membrane protein, multidrug efflux system